jgi:hypothetical protein
MAEKKGFEPSRQFLTICALSRGVPSTTRPPLQDGLVHEKVAGAQELFSGSGIFLGADALEREIAGTVRHGRAIKCGLDAAGTLLPQFSLFRCNRGHNRGTISTPSNR